MPRWLRGHGGYVLALLRLLAKLPAFPLRLTQLIAPTALIPKPAPF